ncbi:hypothetical protein AMATHDRAFT_2253 [Amanita thiersii Skay4041]|uniref:RING-type domain-containing protein n=1 Tax=Amanita thiersii Skay4041 TaxID=703135 RepID=A0A2A9NVE1_9AGAR|nr:hypothetical protein AMATHDRAFT_2253 [Amanita thiersii Skay4041]
MSSRESLWFCHECNSEMMPIMAPNPLCSHCHSEFVEKMENTADDPREFAHANQTDFDAHGLPPGLDAFISALQSISEPQHPVRSRPRPEAETSGSRFTFSVLGEHGPRTISIGGPNTLRRPNSGSESHVPTMSEYLRRESPPNAAIAGPLMAQYLMTMLGHNDPISLLFSRRSGGGVFGPDNGRLGDYVFSQEALDQIISQLMENSNASRPVPASDDIIKNLHRDVLLAESDILQQDCAVCKEQFSLETDNPDELTIVTLPCKHIFHEPCIIPWLRSSGTCPVYALVPQPGQGSTSPAQSSPESPSQQTRSTRSRSPDNNPQASGFLQTLLGGFGRANDNNSHRRSNSDPSRGTRRDSSSHFPGSWEEGLD